MSDDLQPPTKREMKHAARLYAVQALYQMEQGDLSADKVRQEFLDHRFGASYDIGEFIEGDVNHFTQTVDTAVNYQVKIDKMTDRALVAKWPIARIDPVLRALFRAAGAELTESDTPPKVAIIEYVQIAQAFFPEGREGKFVNAVLDHMAREARPEAF